MALTAAQRRGVDALDPLPDEKLKAQDQAYLVSDMHCPLKALLRLYRAVIPHLCVSCAGAT